VKIKANKKAFTIIELIVVMAIIGILVLLAVPKFMGHTKEAKFTKLVSNAKQLENASERYYMDKQDWPRLTDIPYTSAQITAYAQKIYDATGKEMVLDPTGNYYDIDYSKLSKYISIPDDKTSYIIQNPVGNIYALENLTKAAETRTTDIQVTGITLNSSNVGLTVGATSTLTATISPINVTNNNVSWTSSNTTVATVNSSGAVTGVAIGTTNITAKTVDGSYVATSTVTVYNGVGVLGATGMQLWTPTSGYIRNNLTNVINTTLYGSATGSSGWTDRHYYMTDATWWYGPYSSAKIKFNFTGTAFKIVGLSVAGQHKIKVNGVDYNLPTTGIYTDLRVIFNMSNIPYGNNVVEIYHTDSATSSFWIDCVDYK